MEDVEIVSDYRKAVNIVNDLKLFKELIISVSSVGNFRKYLAVMQSDKRFVTERKGEKLKVLRIK